MEWKRTWGWLLAVWLAGQCNAVPSHDNHFVDSVFNRKFYSNTENRNVIIDAIIDKILNIYAPVSDSFDNDLCRNHSRIYKEAVNNYEMWALKMLDASSKIPDGVLMGDVVQMGNYDECVGVEDVPSSVGPFSGQYCLASVGRGGAAGEPIRILPAQPGGGNAATRGGGGALLSLAAKWAVCIPSSCRSNDLQLHLNDALRPVLGNASLKVGEMTCSSRAHKIAFTASDWFAVGFMSFFGLLVVFSTAYDLFNTNSASRNSLLLSFSVYTNGRKLLHVGPPSSDSLQALHGVRFFSMMWVVLGHRYLFSALTPAINTAVVVGYFSDWKHIVITNATLSVDSFFLLSGILVCYIFLREMDRGARFSLPLYYLHRYIRLTPAFGVMMLLTATLVSHGGEGPFWGTNMQFARENCQDSWWASMLYVNNYVKIDSMCLGQAWYLAVDMQLFWISPLILYPLWRWPRYGKLLLAVLFVAGLLIAFLVPYVNQFKVTAIAGGGDAGKMQYFPAHTRFTPWLVGLALGYLLRRTKHDTLRLSPLAVSVGWLASVGLLLTTWLLAHRFQQPGHAYERVFESLYTCLMRPGWALGLAWVIFACVTGYGGFVNSFLSWEVFQVLGRFTYTVYLTHFTVMTWISASVRTPEYISDTAIVTKYFGDVIISFACAFVLSVMFESPAIVIEKYILGNGGRAGQSGHRDAEKLHKVDDPSYDNSSPRGGVENQVFTGDDNSSPRGSVENQAFTGDNNSSPRGSVKNQAFTGGDNSSPRGSVDNQAFTGDGK